MVILGLLVLRRQTNENHSLAGRYRDRGEIPALQKPCLPTAFFSLRRFPFEGVDIRISSTAESQANKDRVQTAIKQVAGNLGS